MLWSSAPEFCFLCSNSAPYVSQECPQIWHILSLNHKIMSISSVIFQILCNFLVIVPLQSSTHLAIIHIHKSPVWIPFYCICNFSLTKLLPQIHWNLTILWKAFVLYRLAMSVILAICNYYASIMLNAFSTYVLCP